MSFGAELRVYLATLKCLGLLCVTHDERTAYKTHVSSRDDTITFAAFAMAQCIALLALLYVATSPRAFWMPEYSPVGNTYLVINLSCSCLLVALTYLYFYAKRRSCLALLSLLLYHNRVELQNCYAARFFWLYCAYFALAALYGVLNFKSYTYSAMELLPALLLSTFFTYSFVLIGLIIVFYNCLVQILASLLRAYNRQLLAATSTAVLLLRLRQRHRLLWVCHEQLNSDLGLVLVLVVAYTLLTAPAAPFFVISIVFEIDEQQVGIAHVIYALASSLGLNVPWLAALLMILRKDVVWKEANKTAKILAKIPRTGSGVDRMVEKFLLKNLRNQPILTAYGFFALDKSTLFKLFTAIITYMVILVQFKEMENSTKSIPAQKM